MVTSLSTAPARPRPARAALRCALSAALLAALAPARSRADTPPTTPPTASAPAASAPPALSPASTPRLHHAPPATALAGEPLTIQATIDFPDRLRHAWLIHRVGDGALQVTEFRRAPAGAYAAVIDGVTEPSVAYCVELELTDGERLAAFASRDELHEVQVRDTDARQQERAALARLGGRRSVVTTSAEYVSFGRTDATVPGPDGRLTTTTLSDQYYRIEAGYTYRLLGTVAEFGIRGGMVRGRSQVPGATDTSKSEVGLNYGAPTLRLRLDDWLHVEGTLLTSVTEVGFSTGAGGAVLLGDPYGGKLTLGFESVQTFGTRFYSRLDLVVAGRIGVAPVVEVTNMPHSSRYGVRLLTEVTVPLTGGLRAAGRLGYQARDADSGGPGAGLSLAYAF
jgi:hypothetical protein